MKDPSSREYKDSMVLLIRYLNDMSILYFIRDSRIEIVVDDSSIFIN